MNLLTYLPVGLIILNILFIILLIFFERRDPTSTWAWLLILTLLPVIGFILYLFLGLTPRKKQVFQRKREKDNIRDIAYVDDSKALKIPESDFDPLEESIIRLGLRNKT
ncbi:MAG: PLDc N-terminal domain-containing protein, partial [Bacillota bacterium]